MDLKLKDNSKLKLSPYTLEYIEGTGTQYIDTGYKPNSNTRVVIDMMIPASATDGFIFGSRNGYGNGEFGLIYKPSQNEEGRFGSKTMNLGNLQTDTRFILDANRNVWDISGVTHTCDAATFTTNYNFILFGFDSGSVITPNSLRVYSCKIYDNDVLVRDYIPCLDRDDVPCLYDKLKDKPFYNQGTGKFVAGPIVKLDLPDNILLKTTTLYHENTPNVDGLPLLNTILNYQKTHQDEVKGYYYSTTPLWQNIITEYPNIENYSDLNKKIIVVICEDADPYAKASEISGYADNIVQFLTAHPNLIPYIKEDYEIVHNLIDTSYYRWMIPNNSIINTKHSPTNNSKFDFLLKRIEIGSFASMAKTGIADYTFTCMRTISSGYCGCTMYEEYPAPAPPSADDIYYLESFTYLSYKINNVLYNTGATGSGNRSGDYLRLFCYYANNSETYLNNYGMNFGKIYNNNTLINYFIPFNGKNRQGCLDIHDLDNPVFFPKTGTGSFTYTLEPKNA